MKLFYQYMMPALLLLTTCAAYSQQGVGIGTTNPDNNAVLDIRSTTKGVLIPAMTTQVQQAGLPGTDGAGMLARDSATGLIKWWTGNAQQLWQSIGYANAPAAAAPLLLAGINISIHAGATNGDLITWDGNNWVNMQPPALHFDTTVDNRQPWLALNYCIAISGIYPSAGTAAGATSPSQPFLGEIYVMGCNFTPLGFLPCDGSLLPINQYASLFTLIGTSYGGDGTSNFRVPDLRGRVAMHAGTGAGLSQYNLGQQGGSEQKRFTY